MKKLILLVAVVLLCSNGYAQNEKLKTFVLGFYNIENLFDTIKSETTFDEEFTPDGGYGWNSHKYLNKLERMAYAISKLPPGLAALGLCEIENREVVQDLVNHPLIADKKYEIVHYDSPDWRGVDVGLIYNPKLFKVKSSSSHRIKTEIPDFISRDQLLVTGEIDGEEISIIVLHWPSRRGGVSGVARRRDAALTTKAIADSILTENPLAKLVIMGDLNDDPIDASCVEHLKAYEKQNEVKPGQLFNTTWSLYKKGIGSLGYNDGWNLFDQTIVSYGLLGNDYSSLKWFKSKIFNEPFLAEQEGRYKGYPKRTTSGGVWKNGYSDHFPSLLWLVKKAE